MTPLRKQMINNMTLKNMSTYTIDSYVNSVYELAKFYNKSPDRITLDEIQRYLLYLQKESALSMDGFKTAISAITFFYNEVLKDRTFNIKPLLTKSKHIPPKILYNTNRTSSLRKKMIDEMKFRRFSENTIESYVFAVAGLAKFYNITPEKITNDEAQSYLLYLQEERGLSWSTCNVVASGLIFFYNEVLDSKKIKFKLPPRKQKFSLPEVLSKEEIEALFNSTSNMRDRILLMTTYSAGLRVGELVILRPKNIDSKRMTIRIEAGKGNKDRYTILSTKLLSNLRTYYQNYKPGDYMFPSKTTGKHITTSVVQKVYKKAKNKAKISKGHGIHILRHNFATNLYEEGVDIRIIQKLLGHKSLSSTMVYTRISRKSVDAVKSPLDLIDFNLN